MNMKNIQAVIDELKFPDLATELKRVANNYGEVQSFISMLEYMIRFCNEGAGETEVIFICNDIETAISEYREVISELDSKVQLKFVMAIATVLEIPGLKPSVRDFIAGGGLDHWLAYSKLNEKELDAVIDSANLVRFAPNTWERVFALAYSHFLPVDSNINSVEVSDISKKIRIEWCIRTLSGLITVAESDFL